MPRPPHGSQSELDHSRDVARDDRPTRDDRSDDPMRTARDATQRVFDQAREAFEPMQSSIGLSGPVIATRINVARAMTRSMMETQARLAMAWVDLAWSPLIAMSRMMRTGQDSAGTGAPGPR